ncbi:outer membrane protein assembly factor BamE [Defluviimonas sp. WL0050]|uniref:Outer membrane protein assembly factor BamE n=1 Tax=Albidovulum litorale TaxID=2984134 RepID=A0ABT2ZQF4_9RHOB|nr:outer membrane protein assembly factor BamE [Defluviimonas sp. WL0050]MCV2872971.1 outer membrane protein assembly factor BamE [Defluviimonas sp. WL0050]
MGRLGSGMKRGAAMLMLVVLAACSAQYRNHGYVPRDEDLEKVVVGESTQETVARAVGRPSSTGLLTGGAWYYVGSRFRHYGGKAPQEVDRQVVAITFDEGGTVENVERFGLEDGQAVVLSRRVTDSNIKGLSFLRQLLGNIGNISAGQVLGDNS